MEIIKRFIRMDGDSGSDSNLRSSSGLESDEYGDGEGIDICSFKETSCGDTCYIEDCLPFGIIDGDGFGWGDGEFDGAGCGVGFQRPSSLLKRE